MGQPSAGNAALSRAEHIGAARTSGGSDTSQYPEERKSTETPRVVASERGSAQTRRVQAGTRCPPGVAGLRVRTVPGPAAVTKPGSSRSRVEPRATEGNRPVGERALDCRSKLLSRTAAVKRGLNPGGPPPKAKYSLVTDSELVP